MYSADSPHHRTTVLRLLLRTGDHCTETGWWTNEELNASRFITEGSLMPSVEGMAGLWGKSANAACAARCERCPCGKSTASQSP